jgi:hypothetical protein
MKRKGRDMLSIVESRRAEGDCGMQRRRCECATIANQVTHDSEKLTWQVPYESCKLYGTEDVTPACRVPPSATFAVGSATGDYFTVVSCSSRISHQACNSWKTYS